MVAAFVVQPIDPLHVSLQSGIESRQSLDDPEVARIRHVYVVPDVRGVGVGRALVLAMVDHARLGFTRVRLRTVRPQGSAFYLAI